MYHYVAGGSKGIVDAQAFLSYWYQVGSLAGAAFAILVKRSVSLKAKAEAEIFFLSVLV